MIDPTYTHRWGPGRRESFRVPDTQGKELDVHIEVPGQCGFHLYIWGGRPGPGNILYKKHFPMRTFAWMTHSIDVTVTPSAGDLWFEVRTRSGIGDYTFEVTEVAPPPPPPPPPPEEEELPDVNTLQVSDKTSTSITVPIELVSVGTDTPVSLWAETHLPDEEWEVHSYGEVSTPGTYSVTIEDLPPATKIYYRAVGMTEVGKAYGVEYITFTLKPEEAPPPPEEGITEEEAREIVNEIINSRVAEAVRDDGTNKELEAFIKATVPPPEGEGFTKEQIQAIVDQRLGLLAQKGLEHYGKPGSPVTLEHTEGPTGTQDIPKGPGNRTGNEPPQWIKDAMKEPPPAHKFGIYGQTFDQDTGEILSQVVVSSDSEQAMSIPPNGWYVMNLKEGTYTMFAQPLDPSSPLRGKVDLGYVEAGKYVRCDIPMWIPESFKTGLDEIVEDFAAWTVKAFLVYCWGTAGGALQEAGPMGKYLVSMVMDSIIKGKAPSERDWWRLMCEGLSRSIEETNFSDTWFGDFWRDFWDEVSRRGRVDVGVFISALMDNIEAPLLAWLEEQGVTNEEFANQIRKIWDKVDAITPRWVVRIVDELGLLAPPEVAGHASFHVPYDEYLCSKCWLQDMPCPETTVIPEDAYSLVVNKILPLSEDDMANLMDIPREQGYFTQEGCNTAFAILNLTNDDFDLTAERLCVFRLAVVPQIIDKASQMREAIKAFVFDGLDYWTQIVEDKEKTPWPEIYRETADILGGIVGAAVEISPEAVKEVLKELGYTKVPDMEEAIDTTEEAIAAFKALERMLTDVEAIDPEDIEGLAGPVAELVDALQAIAPQEEEEGE